MASHSTSTIVAITGILSPGSITAMFAMTGGITIVGITIGILNRVSIVGMLGMIIAAFTTERRFTRTSKTCVVREKVSDSRAELRKAYSELRKDRMELRRDLRNGVSKDEIIKDRQEIRSDMKEIYRDRVDLHKGQVSLDSARREVRNDLRKH